jgi:hypothetical protein
LLAVCIVAVFHDRAFATLFHAALRDTLLAMSERTKFSVGQKVRLSMSTGWIESGAVGLVIRTEVRGKQEIVAANFDGVTFAEIPAELLEAI